MKIISQLKKIKEGSVLAYTLILLFVLFLVSMGIFAVTLTGQKSTMTSDKSVKAFQIASHGVEYALSKMALATDIKDVAQAMTGNANVCANGEIVMNNVFGGSYTISFFDSSDARLTRCNDLVSDVEEVRSTGVFSGTTRAIETAAAHAGGNLECQSVSSANNCLVASVNCPATHPIATGGGCRGNAPGYISVPLTSGSNPTGWQCTWAVPGICIATAICCK